ncbi:MAG: hypothetical protein PHW69_07580 [Elusimicrobiaceae bacterium]|nr:hypothetical protein [Elusimicrobiaceae bacterium]
MKKMKAVSAVLFASLFVLALVQMRVEAVKTGYQINRINTQLSVKTARNRHLQFKLQALKSPANIEAMAQARLNMVHPSPCMTAKLETLGKPSVPGSRLVAKVFNTDLR